MINVNFKGYKSLQILIDDTDIGRQYQKLVQENYETKFPIYRCNLNYTKEYLLDLVQEAKSKLGWDWQSDNYSIDITTKLHKDIEQIVGSGFHAIPEELDNLIHELHYCLHLVQGNRSPGFGGWLQIEWYNDSGFELTKLEIFKQQLNIGDVKLQNPFVGHSPIQIYIENDFTNIKQTCKFHDFVKPGINIVIENFPEVDKNQVLKKFEEADPDFVKFHTKEKILNFTGYPVIGSILNKDYLMYIINNNQILELESLEFNNEFRKT